MINIGLEKGNIPLYVQLEQIIKSQIVMGHLIPGEQIPVEKELAKMYKVSSITVKRAILNLTQQGLLARKQGKGTFVQESSLPSINHVMTVRGGGGIKDVIPEGLWNQKPKVLEMKTVTCPKQVAIALNLDMGQKVFEIRRTRREDNAPLSYIKNYLSVELGERISKEDLINYPMLHILRNKLGVHLERGLQYIIAVVADYEIANALSVGISAPVLYLETIIFAEEKKPVEFVQTFHRSDRFKYTINMDLNLDRS